MRIRVRLGGDVEAEGELFEEQAPRTVRALWERLPIRDRTIQARWSGDAWRTEENYELLDKDAPVENPAGQLSAGRHHLLPRLHERPAKGRDRLRRVTVAGAVHGAITRDVP